MLPSFRTRILQVGTEVAEGDRPAAVAGCRRLARCSGFRGTISSRAPRIGAAGRHRIGQLDLVELLIAPQAHQHRSGGPSAKRASSSSTFSGLGGIEAMAGAELLDAALTRGGQGAAGRGLQRHGRLRQGDRPLLVGGIAAVGAGQDQILAGLGGDHEFLAGGAADGTAVGLDRHGPQAAALEDAAVGPVHGAIGAAQAGLVGMEGIGVLHDEFPAPHQPEAGPDLIAELGLDLIKTDRQLAVGAQQVGGQFRHHLLVGGAEAEVPLLAVVQVEHDPLAGGVPLPAATAPPELGGLQLGQEGFEGVRRRPSPRARWRRSSGAPARAGAGRRRCQVPGDACSRPGATACGR